MFIILKHTDKYKGILVMTHVEYKMRSKIINELKDKYHIFGCWCDGYPSNLRTHLATYYTDNIFYKNRISDVNTEMCNNLLKKINIDGLCLDNSRCIDLIHIGRVC